MIVYILKFSLLLGTLLLVYRFFLEKESFHKVKRIYLLGTLIFCAITPLITIQEYAIIDESTIQIIELPTTENSTTASLWESFVAFLPTLLIAIYLIGCSFFGIRFILNLISIKHKIEHNQKVKSDFTINVLLKEKVIPHTFFNYIFYQKHQFLNQAIPEEIKCHEQTHAKQLHSLDVLLVETIQILLWFNPLLYYLKHHIKLNHEFLADDAVLQSGISKMHYQHTLLQYAQTESSSVLASAFNYSSIKKRITIMKTQTPTKKKWLKTLILIPVFGGLFYGFAPKEIIPLNANDQEISEQKHATKAQLAEYNKLAKYYNEQEPPMKVDIKDMKRIHDIYNLMSANQKANAQPLPNFPPPPPPVPEAPKVAGSPAQSPPPPPLPANATKGQIKAYKEGMKPKPPKAPKPAKQVIKEMKAKGAKFYFDGKKITADEAMAKATKNKNINVYTKKSKSKKELQVHLSDKPMVVEIEVTN